ncbi:raffinose/stachyose/melibiose transport system permease protein [Streptomyces sp. SAI-208]|uniref:carbohydrate ABC transporter permease n=1 Tax=unclassified Streptomyces TaxID=2593676 RepID=UPI002474CA88|nr:MULTISPECIES: carbohydrate ABC transporter permease [unclassified Streptomyces]MDH6514125.1 raffinose/stachyose/melibiose transport system permease protein [Streptomyces sp. SAI-090]MDH6565400.1 raffinose/stachyose/melibiose transport system permease protein [Streptomyces sp. SAI-117]MDH6589684.1 raffinose/stachyose/melibiose transport system permease protein [Streptomyces sp. SAI-133]MDH6604963.1 raffinose/stachyose/melibiose transport system permease protein [Streptomyces sp. SAI-208]MDH6
MNISRREAITGRVFLVLLMVVTLLPFVSMLSAALQPRGTVPSGLEWPSDPHWHNFVDAFDVANMGALLKSSLLIVAGVVPAAVFIATLAGFGLGHLKVRGGAVAMGVLLLGLTMPFEAVITPIYYQIRDLGLLNTRWAIILPLIGLYMPFSVYWMRAHFLNVPKELSEAARVDGATTWQLFRRIHIPLARPAISSLTILLFLWTWNQFLLSIVLVDDPSKRTMAGALGAFQGQWGTDLVLLCAGSLLILTPTLVIFLIFQRQFISALLQGSVKG